MTKVEVPQEIAEEIATEAAKRNGDKPPLRPKKGQGKDRGKRLDSLLDGVTRNLFETLSEAKRRQDYALVLQVTDRLIQIGDLETRRLEGSERIESKGGGG
jgi:hypothetical protein